mmetsp:Transcript_69703/g.113096  ORF Transcript_69703/g.113096 Transcript_69703/m.113096 type:complete len:274 (-) Transcript_69703:898-1719(-)
MCSTFVYRAGCCPFSTLATLPLAPAAALACAMLSCTISSCKYWIASACRSLYFSNTCFTNSVSSSCPATSLTATNLDTIPVRASHPADSPSSNRNSASSANALITALCNGFAFMSALLRIAVAVIELSTASDSSAFSAASIADNFACTPGFASRSGHIERGVSATSIRCGGSAGGKFFIAARISSDTSSGGHSSGGFPCGILPGAIKGTSTTRARLLASPGCASRGSACRFKDVRLLAPRAYCERAFSIILRAASAWVAAPKDEERRVTSTAA